jgi:hypothetical protein
MLVPGDASNGVKWWPMKRRLGDCGRSTRRKVWILKELA